jgi:hypothetical protein
MNQLGLAKPIIERLRSGNNLDLAKQNNLNGNNIKRFYIISMEVFTILITIWGATEYFYLHHKLNRTAKPFKLFCSFVNETTLIWQSQI